MAAVLGRLSTTGVSATQKTDFQKVHQIYLDSMMQGWVAIVRPG